MAFTITSVAIAAQPGQFSLIACLRLPISSASAISASVTSVTAASTCAWTGASRPSSFGGGKPALIQATTMRADGRIDVTTYPDGRVMMTFTPAA